MGYVSRLYSKKFVVVVIIIILILILIVTHLLAMTEVKAKETWMQRIPVVCDHRRVGGMAIWAVVARGRRRVRAWRRPSTRTRRLPRPYPESSDPDPE